MQGACSRHNGNTHATTLVEFSGRVLKMRQDGARVLFPVCSNTMLPPCRFVIRKHLVDFVVILSLFVAVHLTAWYYLLSPRPSAGVVTRTAYTANASRSVPDNVTESTGTVITVDVDSNFTDRVTQFNIKLQHLRRQLQLLQMARHGLGGLCKSDGDRVGCVDVVMIRILSPTHVYLCVYEAMFLHSNSDSLSPWCSTSLFTSPAATHFS